MMIVFSFFANDAQYIRPFLDPSRSASGDRLLKMVSVRILNSCENFVIAPRFWNGLDDRKKSAIRDFYDSSSWTDGRDLETQDSMLFGPEEP
jgi:hypothetical protein